MGLKSFKRYMMIFFFSLVIDELVLCLILWTGWSVCCRSFIVHCKMQPEMLLVCDLDESSLVVVTIAWLWHRRSRVEARYDAKRAGRSRCFPFKKKSLAPAFCSFHRKKALEKVGIRHSLCRTACMQTIWGLTQHLILRNQVSPRLHAYAIKCKIFFGLKIALLSQSCNCDLREQARRFFTAKLLSQAEFAWLKKRLVCLSIANKWFGKDKIIKVWNVKYVEGE